MNSIGILPSALYDPDHREDLMPLNHVHRSGYAALAEVAYAFVLADPAWGAFQMSLSASCQP